MTKQLDNVREFPLNAPMEIINHAKALGLNCEYSSCADKQTMDDISSLDLDPTDVNLDEEYIITAGGSDYVFYNYFEANAFLCGYSVGKLVSSDQGSMGFYVP